MESIFVVSFVILSFCSGAALLAGIMGARRP